MTDAHLLSDEQMQRFVAHGFVELRTTVGDNFHREIRDRLEALTEGNVRKSPGNNLLPLVPRLVEVLEDPAVRGALTSVIGHQYAVHQYRAIHTNVPGSVAQAFHKDNYWGYRRRVRNHRPRWVMLMYYPQDTPVELGPTAVIPGSQYQTRRPDANVLLDRPGVLGAGGCVLMHYDLWHRKMKNLSNHNRYMVKFQFARMQQPLMPTWEHKRSDWCLDDVPSLDMSAVWHRQWRWLLNAADGTIPAPSQSVDAADLVSDDTRNRLRAVNGLATQPDVGTVHLPRLAALLHDVSDAVSINAAYAMASIGTDAIPYLCQSIRQNDGLHVDESGFAGQSMDTIPNEERVGRAAAFGLIEIGETAVASLLALLRDGKPRARKLAVFALGELGLHQPETIVSIAEATKDPEHSVRLNAVEALGLGRATASATEALISCLEDSEPDVRFAAALSLARFGREAECATAALSRALSDPNRYVSGHAVEALDRIGTREAAAVLVPFLKTARWCPHTTERSPF